MADRATPVAINARAAVRREIGGVERYVREMALRLPELAPARYRVLRPPTVFAHRAGHLWEQALLPLAGAEFLYCGANLAPVASHRNVVVIHDAAVFRHPEAYSAPYVAYQRLMLPALAKRARLVITVSEFSRAELVELMGIAPDRVHVISGGVDTRFVPEADPAAARSAYGLNNPYVLTVGTVSARKHLEALEPAARALRELGIELVLAGSGRRYLPSTPPRLRRLGYVADQHLPGLYAGARALVMPSVYEGFGLPCLEAMAAGVPVVASAAGALPETCGDAALLVDASELTPAVLAAVEDEDLRAQLRSTGLQRAARYSWSRTAAFTNAAIGGLLGDD